MYCIIKRQIRRFSSKKINRYWCITNISLIVCFGDSPFFYCHLKVEHNYSSVLWCFFFGGGIQIQIGVELVELYSNSFARTSGVLNLHTLTVNVPNENNETNVSNQLDFIFTLKWQVFVTCSFIILSYLHYIERTSLCNLLIFNHTK